MVLWQYRDLFFEGLLVTLQLTVLSFLFAMLVGTVMAIFRISPIAPLRAVGLIYVDIFRNVPLLSLIIVVVYALPEIGLMWSYNNSVIISMSLVGGAFICESLRAGINSVPAGQIEAARSLFRSPRRSTVVEYAHAFCEGTYRRRRTLAFRAGRRGCMPRLRTARFRMPRTVCLAAHGGSAGRRSLPRPSLLFLSIPLAHGFARGAATCRNPARRARSRQGHVRH